MMLRPALVLLLLPFAAAQDDLDALIRQLGDDDIAVRERAGARLKERLPASAAALEAAARGAGETAERARDILAKTTPFRILFGAGKPSPFAKSEPLPVTFVLRNTSRENLLYLKEGFSYKIHLLELFEEPPQKGRRTGSTFGGRASTGCALSENDFGVLGFEESASLALADLRETHGITIPDETEKKYPEFSEVNPVLAGRYRIDARYHFDRSAYVALCRKNCAGHADPKAVWNRCPESPFEARSLFDLR